MKRHAYGFPVLVLTAVLAGAGCTVEQTDEGEMPDVSYQEGELPDVDVEGGDLPSYDIDWVNVDVGITRKTVTVPTVDVSTEEREISVPYLDFTLPDGDREVEHWIVGERPPGVDSDYEFVISKPSVPASSRIIYSS